MALEGSLMRALVDALEEPALIVEGLGISFANDAARLLLGSGIEGRDVRLAIRHPDALEHILTGRASEVEVAGIAQVGRPWRVVVRDLGHGSTFVRLIDRAGPVSAEKLRVDFVANASHELRTPLAAIIGYAETLTDDTELESAVRQKFSQTIRQEAQRMLRLIEDLMSLSRIQADKFIEPSGTVDLASVLKTAVANAGRFRDGGKCGINLDVPKRLPKVKGDEPQLLQLFDNLLSNAIRYGCDRKHSTIDVSATITGRWVTVVVQDHGQGIAKEHLYRLTERFYRVDEARSRDNGGTGLGLAIVKHVTERHKATLSIESEVGVGTKVTVGLPVNA